MDGRVYKGIHRSIVTRELFNRVQETFVNHNRPMQRKHEFSFTGLLTCKRCGCTITAEIKKNKYIYYHCTGYKGNCGNTRTTEEGLDKRFAELVRRVEVPSEIAEWIKEALLESHKDEKIYHDTQIKNLETQYKKLQSRIDAMYIDKLDGKIGGDYFLEKSEEWRKEQEKLREAIERHKKANVNYLTHRITILELARKAYRLYLEQKPTEKRKLLKILLSNCTFDSGKLYPTYNRPFDSLVKSKENDDWLPGLDDVDNKPESD